MYGSRENFRIVSVGPRSESGGMIAFTRLPSGRRASTIGRGLVDSPADLRHDLVDDPQEMGVVGERRRRPLDLAVALDVDPVEGVDHDLGHGVVPEQRLQRPVAEDVVGDLADDAPPLLARERGAVERELLRDLAQDALGEVLARLGREQVRAELRDAGVVDPSLQLGVWIGSGLDRRLADCLTRAERRRLVVMAAAVAVFDAA